VPGAQAFDLEVTLARVRHRIEQAGGDPGAVRIVAVTKGFGPAAVSAALAAGLPDVGENYAQELVAKAAALGTRASGGAGGGARWHFLGAVQRNKVRVLAPLVSCWQGVAREAEGEAIALRRPGATVLVEVDETGAPGRNGCRPDAVPALVASLRGMDLDVRGLMVVAPVDRVTARDTFRAVRELADRLGLPERSMGMSDDLELGVTEGSTMVRLGRALFGPRPPRR
jgi:PLP dependent protein